MIFNRGTWTRYEPRWNQDGTLATFATGQLTLTNGGGGTYAFAPSTATFQGLLVGKISQPCTVAPGPATPPGTPPTVPASVIVPPLLELELPEASEPLEPLELLELLEPLDEPPLDDPLPELALDPELLELEPEVLASPLLVPPELLDPADPLDPPELAELAELPKPPKPPELVEPPEAPPLPLPLEAAAPESSPPPEDALPPPPQPAGEISEATVARPRAPSVDSETRSLR